MPARSYSSHARAVLSSAFRPSAEEVENYARLIAAREGRPLDECRNQAELQLWACPPEPPRRARRAVPHDLELLAV